MRRVIGLGAILSLAFLALLGFVGPAQAADASPRMVHLEARQVAYSPGVIRAPQGARVHLELSSHDVTHGFLLEGYGVDLAAIYSAIFLGPWGGLKQEALLQTPLDALRHTLLIVGGAGVVAPLLWLGVATLTRLASGRRDLPLRAVWAGSAQALVPLGLLAWVAFTVTFVLGSGSYVVSTIADPLGWGWRLFGLEVAWAPLLTDLRPWLQLASWLVGFAWASRVALRVSRRLFGAGSRGGVILVLGLAVLTGGLMWLGLG